MTAADIYRIIGQKIEDHQVDDWFKAFIRVEYTPGRASSDGIHYMLGENMLVKLPATLSLGLHVRELYKITTQGGNNHWNVLYFTMAPSGAFEVNFDLDESIQSRMTAIAQTQSLPAVQRDEQLTHIENELAEAKAQQLYTSISQALATLPNATWQEVQLEVKRGGDAIRFSCSYIPLGSTSDETEELAVYTNWELVKRVYELGKMGSYHADWNCMNLVISLSGEYEFSFHWQPDASKYVPAGKFPYTREGRWQETA